MTWHRSASCRWYRWARPTPSVLSTLSSDELRRFHRRAAAGAASQADRSFARSDVAHPRRARPSGAQAAAGDPCRRHQRQGLDHRLHARDPGGGGPARARLHVAASRALQRALPARRAGRRACSSPTRSSPKRWPNASAPMPARRSRCSRSPPRPGSCCLRAIRRTCCCSRSGSAAGSTPPMWSSGRSRPSSRRCRSIMPSISATRSPSIAAEKAGILKRGVPAIVAAQPREALAVIERAAARVKAPIRIAGEDWTATEERGRLVYQDDAGLLDLPAPQAARTPPVRECRRRHRGIARRRGAQAAARRPSKPASPRPIGRRACSACRKGSCAALAPAGQRVVARRRPQCRRRARHRQCARRSRGAGVAPAGADRRHALDQGLRGLPEEFRRAGAPPRRGADSAIRRRACPPDAIVGMAHAQSASRRRRRRCRSRARRRSDGSISLRRRGS